MASRNPAPLGRYLLWGAILGATPAIVVLLLITVFTWSGNGFNSSIIPLVLGVSAVFALVGTLCGLVGWVAVLPVAAQSVSVWARASAAGGALLVVGLVLMLILAGGVNNFGVGYLLVALATGIGGFCASSVHERRALTRRPGGLG